MMKSICAIVVIAALINSAEPKVTFNPFSVSFPKWYDPLAFLLMAIAVILFRHSGYVDGLKRGYEIVIDEVVKSTEDEKCKETTITRTEEETK